MRRRRWRCRGVLLARAGAARHSAGRAVGEIRQGDELRWGGRGGAVPRNGTAGAVVTGRRGGIPALEKSPHQGGQRDERDGPDGQILPSERAPHPSPSIRPPWNTASEVTQASAFIISTMKIGQRHELVSRRTTATVDMHWQASTKNTIRLIPVSGV